MNHHHQQEDPLHLSEKLSGSRRNRIPSELQIEQHHQNQENNNNNNGSNTVVAPPKNNAASAISFFDVISFNCGGQIITVQSSKITQKFPDSYLANFIHVAADPVLSTALDRDRRGHILLDRDPRLFLCVINFCRGHKNIGPVNDEELEALIVEADFWCLPELRAAVEERIGVTVSIFPLAIRKYHFTISPPPEALEKIIFSENEAFISEVFSNNNNNNNDQEQSDKAKEIAKKMNKMLNDPQNNSNDNNIVTDAEIAFISAATNFQREIREAAEDRLKFVYENSFFALLEPPNDLRFIRGPGVNADRTGIRNSFCVGLIGNGTGEEYSMEEEAENVLEKVEKKNASSNANTKNSNNNDNNINIPSLEAPRTSLTSTHLQKSLIRHQHNGVQYYNAGCAMSSGVHTLNIEVIRCDYLGIGIIADPVGAGFLPTDCEYHKNANTIGYYHTGVFHCNFGGAPFKDDTLTKFGPGAVVQLRVDMDNRLFECFTNGGCERMQSIGNCGRIRFAIVMKHDTCVSLVSPDRAAFLIGKAKALRLLALHEKTVKEAGVAEIERRSNYQSNVAFGPS